MMPVSGLPRNLFRNLRSRINQYESTTGRRVGQQTIQALLEAELATAAERASQDAHLELQKSTTEREFGLREKEFEEGKSQFAQNLKVRQEEGAFNRETERTRLGLEADRIKAEKSAAKISGGLQLASTGIQGGILYKMMKNPSGTGDTASTSNWLKGAIAKLRGEEQTGVVSPSGGLGGSTAEAAGGIDLAQSAALGMPAYVPGALEASVSTLSAGTAGPAYSLGTQAGAASPYSLTGVTYNPPAMEAAAFETGAESAGASAGYGAYAGPAAAIVGGAMMDYAGVKSIAAAEEGGGGPAGKAVKEITPWEDSSTAGQVLNATVMAPVTITTGIIDSVVGVVSGGGGSIICTELQRQGYLPERIVELDGLHRERYIDDDTYLGYIKWAKYVVKAMQRSRIMTWLVAPVGRAWAYEMASRLDPEIPGSRFGRILMRIGVPVCRFIGKVGK